MSSFGVQADAESRPEMLAQTFGRLRAESDDRRAVRFERVCDYRPDEVWAAITEPEQLRR